MNLTHQLAFIDNVLSLVPIDSRHTIIRIDESMWTYAFWQPNEFQLTTPGGERLNFDGVAYDHDAPHRAEGVLRMITDRGGYTFIVRAAVSGFVWVRPSEPLTGRLYRSRVSAEVRPPREQCVAVFAEAGVLHMNGNAAFCEETEHILITALQEQRNKPN